MNLLGIETSSEACSCALLVDEKLVFRHQLAPRQHADLILPMIDEVLAETGTTLVDLDGLAFGCGPGSFTGVRIATGVIQGLAYGSGLRVAPVSSLAALAEGAWRDFGTPRVLSAFDARMSQVYWGVYEFKDGCMRLCGDEGVYDPSSVPDDFPVGEWVGVGSGWEAYRESLSRCPGVAPVAVYPRVFPHARDVVMLGKRIFADGGSVAAIDVAPVYLRDSVTYQH